MIISLFYKIEKAGNHLLPRKFQSLLWYILKYSLNAILPVYYKIIPYKKGISSRNYIDNEVIISLTSFPARIITLPLVLESLYRQNVNADRIILWLADSQFPDKITTERFLKKFLDRGLELRFCDDLRAHKKYFYAMKENPSSIIVTYDDDVLCPEDMLHRLLVTYKKHPDCIVTQRAHQMKFYEDGTLKPYGEWNNLAKNCIGPDIYLCQTGGAGCLYFPDSLSEHVFDVDVIKSICLLADDIWLNCMSYLKGTKVVLTGKNNPEIIDVLDNKSNGLAKENVENDFNDKQLKEVTSYYNIEWSKYR